MDESFKLQTTMSPKPLHTKVHIKKPTKLALRKNIRRSSCYDKPPAAVVPINKKEKLKLELSSDSEFDTVESNIDDSFAMFADLSIIPKDNTMKAMNSTFVEGRRTLFHELFQGSGIKNKKPNSTLAQVSNEDVIDNVQILPRETKTSNFISEDIRKIIPQNPTSSQSYVGMIASYKDNRITQTLKAHEESLYIISDSSLERSIVESSISPEKEKGIKKVIVQPYLSRKERENKVLRTEPKKKISEKINQVHKAVCQTAVKKIESNKENVNQNLKLHLFNGGKNKKVCIESPLPIIPTTLKNARRLFPSIDSEDDDFERDSAPVLNAKSSTSESQTITCKSRDVARAKPNSSKKKSVKSTAKYRGVEYLSDSESFGLSDSDWESPQYDYLPKYIKNTQPIGTAQKKQKSFLESLSKNVPIFEAHPVARIFRNDFKKHRDELIARLFKLFNEEVFGTALPINTSIEWNSRLRGTAGYCRNKSITHRDKKLTRSVSISLSSKVVDSPDRLRDTLIHEMCHAVNWMEDGQRGHGPSWRIWTEKARDIFPELPPMSTCHNYNISTKYTYRCKDCGYSFGRHSKSISLEKKCCGYCKGRLELLVNTVSKSGLTNSAPVVATPTRNPTPFALFVKDNYKKCRTPDLKHGDVMRLLSKHFSSLKVEKKINVE